MRRQGNERIFEAAEFADTWVRAHLKDPSRPTNEIEFDIWNDGLGERGRLRGSLIKKVENVVSLTASFRTMNPSTDRESVALLGARHALDFLAIGIAISSILRLHKKRQEGIAIVEIEKSALKLLDERPLSVVLEDVDLLANSDPVQTVAGSVGALGSVISLEKFAPTTNSIEVASMFNDWQVGYVAQVLADFDAWPSPSGSINSITPWVQDFE